MSDDLSFRARATERDSPVSDDDEAAQSSDKIGCIEVQISRVKRMRRLNSKRKVRGVTLPDEGPVQERSKKLGGHRVG